MKVIAGIYETRPSALKAIIYLRNAGFADNQLMLVNKDELLHNHVHIKPTSSVQRAEVMIGFTVGLILGILMGLGLFDFGPLHFLYGRGWLQGAFTGSLLGAWIAAVIGVVTAIIVNIINSRKYDKQLNEGKFLVFITGGRTEVSKARKVLNTPDLNLELE